MLKLYPLLVFFALISHSLKAQISPCLANDSLRVLVIGSSTAAGTGVSVPDSAWVNRYRHYLQSINPANEVINLARGGYNTWRLMPDYFTAPSGRPSPDTLRNISEAIRRNPDVIIINLPSNDAAIGTGTNQQMQNFIHMDSLANSMGIDFWVCTTQPRNGNATLKSIQVAVRDSILSRFGKRAINFWQGIADSSRSIDPNFDSGDGVHLNNHGHRILMQRVINSGMADSNLIAYNGIDLKAFAPTCSNCTSCGSSSTTISYTIQNQGDINSSSNLTGLLIRENIQNSQIDTFRQALPQIASCSSLSFNQTIPTNSGGEWLLKVAVHDPSDSLLANNLSRSYRLNLKAEIDINFNDSIICPQDSIYLKANSTAQIRWFESYQSDSVLQQGDSLYWPASQSDSLYLQAFEGPFYYLSQLQASPSSNIQWNGCMFNLIAFADTVVLDSILFTAGSNGNMAMECRTIAGDYQGYENDSTLWSAPLRDSIYAALIDSSYMLNFGTITINPYDTLGLYLYLKNPTQRLSYQSTGQRASYGDSIFQVELGSGIAAHFGSIYHPRHFKGEFYYHHGFNPLGQCQSERKLMALKVQQAYLSLGKDSLHNTNLDLDISLGSGFSKPQWNYSAIGDTLRILANSYQAGDSIHIILSAEDSIGCINRDSLVVYFYSNIGLINPAESVLNIFPNPTKGLLKIIGYPYAFADASLSIYDLQAKRVAHKLSLAADGQFNLPAHLTNGLYYLKITHLRKQEFNAKVLLER
jgi:lysophospholipase L1-like esterase